jgi:hypothetical protein
MRRFPYKIGFGSFVSPPEARTMAKKHSHREHEHRPPGPRALGGPPHRPAHDEPEDDDFGFDLGSLEFETGTNAFVSIRGQNIELLKLAAQISGHSTSETPLDDPKPVLERIWAVYSELHGWIEPEGEEDEDFDE